MIRAIIFDCFGVLYRDNLSMLYDTVTPERYRELQDIIHATDHGFFTREEYYQKVAELSGRTSEDIRAIEQRQHERDPEMIAYTQTFRPTYKVGVLSNIDVDSMAKLFPDAERNELFDAFVMSGAVGYTKPMPEIFELAAARLGVEPEECIMIDDIPLNIEGAQAAGMKGLVFSSRRQLALDLARVLEEVNA
ncbi:MAG: HAD-IA family hydrolase [Candidatus Saccharimonadales bacterium]